jgi:hypothetical protein
MRWPELVQTMPKPLNDILTDSFARMIVGEKPHENAAIPIWLEVSTPRSSEIDTNELLAKLYSIAIPWFITKLKSGLRAKGIYLLPNRNLSSEALAEIGATTVITYVRRMNRVKPSNLNNL